jgi:sulfatase maturation enzyme AslB (radical SAM superfamily)
MTTWNPEFYDRLAQFKNVEIQISVDGINEVGEYIRYPSDFNKVRENICKAAAMAADRPDWVLKCYTVLQALNFRDVKNIWAFLDQVSKEYHKPIIWWPITLTSPAHLSLAAVTVEERINHIENIKLLWNKTYFKPVYDKTFQIDQNTWNAYYNTIMNSPYDETQHTRLVEYVKFIDRQRLQDGELIFGDLL